MKARGRGEEPSDVTSRAEKIRTLRLGDAMADFESLVTRRAVAIFRADHDEQKRLERQLLAKRAYLVGEGAGADETAVLDKCRLHPDVYEDGECGRLVLPPGAKCWSPYPHFISQTDLYGAIDSIPDFRRYSETQRHEAARAALADRNAAIAGVGSVVREINALTLQLYVLLLPETEAVLTVRASETSYLEEHPSDAMNRRLAGRTRSRRVTGIGRQPPPAFTDDGGSPDAD